MFGAGLQVLGEGLQMFGAGLQVFGGRSTGAQSRTAGVWDRCLGAWARTMGAWAGLQVLDCVGLSCPATCQSSEYLQGSAEMASDPRTLLASSDSSTRPRNLLCLCQEPEN